MGFSKKTGKGRLDKYYFLAKDQGFRARSAFKLVQLHKKYNILDQARVVIDLCAAPGGWLQVAAKYMPASNVIIGVDLVPIKPIPGVKTIVADITTEKCRSELKRELKGWTADVVLHDGAPNVGSAWLHDAYSQSELVLHSLKLATEFLAAGGAFVTKVFRSKDYNALMWVFNQLFNKVEATKPASSRNVSAEIFVVCRGFKAPTHIDPRLLDPRHVFEDITLLQAGGAKLDLLHPDKKQRHREGYEDGATVLYKTATAQDFIHSAEPNTVLATHNAITFTADTPKAILELAERVREVQELCKDLKVLGRREFKILSKWRKGARIALGLDGEAARDGEERIQEVVDVDEDPLEQLDELSKAKQRQDKREKRKALERKAKQRMRMQLSMGNADDLAGEYAENEPLFSLTKKTSNIVGNEDVVLSDSGGEDGKDGFAIENESAIDTLSEASDEALWESELEEAHDERLQRQLKKDAVELVKARRKKERAQEAKAAELSDSEGERRTGEMSDSEGEGKTGKMSDSDEEEKESPSKPASGSDDDDSNDGGRKRSNLTTSLLTKEEESAEKEAKMALWYSNPLFRELGATAVEEAAAAPLVPESSRKKLKQEKKRQMEEAKAAKKEESKAKRGKKGETAGPGEIIFVKADVSEEEEEEISEDAKIAMMTPAGMTLAARLARDQKRAKKDLVDESFNRFAFKDDGPLPTWFFDDEKKHNRPQKPITKEGIALLKAKQRELDARPIKKELEAKGRNRQRIMRKLEALKRKAAVIADSEDMGERQKSEQIQKLLAKAGKPQKKETKLVIAKGTHKGIKGRPRGVKGHYKMVDARMKKEIRAQKRRKQQSSGSKGGKGGKGRSSQRR